MEIVVSSPAGVLVDRVGAHRALGLGALLVATDGLLRAFATARNGSTKSVAISGVGGPVLFGC